LRRVTWFGRFLSTASAPLLAHDSRSASAWRSSQGCWREIEQLLRQHLHHDLIDLDKIPEKVGAQANPMLALELTPHANDAYLVHLTGNWDEFYAAKRFGVVRKTDGKKRRPSRQAGQRHFRDRHRSRRDRAHHRRADRAEEKLLCQPRRRQLFEWRGYRDFFLDWPAIRRTRWCTSAASASLDHRRRPASA